MEAPPLLAFKDVSIGFGDPRRAVPVVEDVSLTIAKGETVALVGESGSGKSVTSLAAMGLIARSGGHILSGRIDWIAPDGSATDLCRLPERAMRARRGRDIAMIFQEPMTSLNPVFTVGNQVTEAITTHRTRNARKARAEAVEALRLVGIPEPERRMSAFPHELSGGMRQRVMIAMALSCDPKLLIADEPTTALDVTIQAQILDLMKALKAGSAMSILWITHDLGVVAEFADRVAVMYAGRIVESGPVAAVIAAPRHPYTAALLASVPRIHGPRQSKLYALGGSVPAPDRTREACDFMSRCPHALPGTCDALLPPLEPSGAGREVRCLRWQSLTGTLIDAG